MDGSEWRLRLGDVLTAASVPVGDVVVIRLTYPAGGLAADATPEEMLEFTRAQAVNGGKFPEVPPRWWVVFAAEMGRRSRLVTVYDNAGEVEAERTTELRFYSLQPSGLLDSLYGRLVIEWSRDALNWAKLGAAAAGFPVVEIASAHVEAFPGYDQVIVPFSRLQQVVGEPGYVRWRAALEAVRGIYLITDTTTGQQYVGKADGAGGVLGRWKAYARTEHDDDVGMVELAQLDWDQPQRYQFSLLQVFGPEVTRARIDAAEVHYKQALGTRRFGLNRN